MHRHARAVRRRCGYGQRLRTRRTVRSRQSATRRPRRAGQAQRPRAAPPLLGQRTGTCGSPGHGTRTRAGTAPAFPPRTPDRPGWPRTSPAGQRPGGGRPYRERVVAGMQGRQLAHNPEDVGVAGQPVEQNPGGGERVLRCRPLAGSHTQTVGHNPRQPLPGARKWAPSSRRSRRPAVKPAGLIVWQAFALKMSELPLRLDAGCSGGIIRFMTDGFVMGPVEGQRVSPAMTLKVGDKNSQAWSMFEVADIGPGFDVGAHLHRNAEELFYVLEGQLDLLAFEPRFRTPDGWQSWQSQTGATVARGGPGSMMYVPRGCPHAFANPGPGPARPA